MPKRNRNLNFYERQKLSEAQQGDIKVNLLYNQLEKSNDVNFIDERYKNVEEKYGMEFSQPVERRTAPTTNPERPRARNMAYMKETETLFIQFRDERVVEYDTPIPPEMWQDLKATDSTGKYLKHSGIDNMPWHYVPVASFPEEVQVLFE